MSSDINLTTLFDNSAVNDILDNNGSVNTLFGVEIAMGRW